MSQEALVARPAQGHLRRDDGHWLQRFGVERRRDGGLGLRLDDGPGGGGRGGRRGVRGGGRGVGDGGGDRDRWYYGEVGGVRHWEGVVGVWEGVRDKFMRAWDGHPDVSLSAHHPSPRGRRKLTELSLHKLLIQHSFPVSLKLRLGLS